MKKQKKKSDTKEDVNNKKSNKKVIIYLIVGLALILGFVAIYFYLNKDIDVENVIVKNIDFHNIEVSWDKSEKDSNYAVLISTNKFTKEEIDDDIKDGKFDLDYQVIEVSDNKLSYDKVMSNTDYYVAVVTYKNKDNKRKYYNSSEVILCHTDSLKIEEITDLSVEDFSDTSVKLKWSLFNTDLKNLDDTDIDVSYTLYSINDEEVRELKNDIKEDNYSILDLTPFTKYSYKIIVNVIVDGKVISSSDSNIVEVTTKPSAVSGLVAKAKGTNSITLNWNKYDVSSINKDASVAYSIYGADSKDGEYKLLKENVTDNSYTETGLTDNKTRYYYVVAYIQANNQKYESNKSTVVSATTNKKTVINNSGSNNNNTSNNSNNNSNTNNNNSNNNSTGKLTQAQKAVQARVIAKKIANSITGSTDLEKVTKAARAVSAYYYNGVHKETGDDYYTAYGVFIKGESSCAGTTRALGMVLEEMGYSWTHVNEHLWTHQWVKITMDGKVGYADGQVGIADYGKHPLE